MGYTDVYNVNAGLGKTLTHLLHWRFFQENEMWYQHTTQSQLHQTVKFVSNLIVSL